MIQVLKMYNFLMTFVLFCTLAIIFINEATQNKKERVTKKRIVNFDEGSIRSCRVCLDEFGSTLDRDLITLPCKHKFHSHCIRDFFKTKERFERFCPLCRVVVSENFIQSSFSDL